MEQLEQKEMDIDSIIRDAFEEFEKIIDLYIKEYGLPSITKLLSDKCLEYAIISYRKGKEIIKLINEKIGTEIGEENLQTIIIHKSTIDSINKTLKSIHNAYKLTILNTCSIDLIEKEFPSQEKEEKEEKEEKKSKKNDGIDKEVKISIKKFAKLIDSYKKEKDQSIELTEKGKELASLCDKAGKNAILVMEKLIKKKIQEANIYTTLYNNTEQASEILNAVEIHKLTIKSFEKILLEFL